MPSFDIVSEVDMQEMDNAVNQAIKEIGNRYDFRGTKCEISWDKKEAITFEGDDDYKLTAMRDILESKVIKRGIGLKSLSYGTPEEASGGTLRQKITILQGIEKEKGKEIVKKIKELKLKVQAQIQDNQVRVTGKKIDDLQEVISAFKSADMGVELQFINMRN